MHGSCRALRNQNNRKFGEEIWLRTDAESNIWDDHLARYAATGGLVICRLDSVTWRMAPRSSKALRLERQRQLVVIVERRDALRFEQQRLY